MRRLSLVASAMALSLVLVGCTTKATDCEDACDYIYGGCQVALLDGNGNQLTLGQCIASCSSLGQANMSGCVRSNACDTNTIVACFQAPGNDCDNACAVVYGTCGITLLDVNSNQMSEGQCASACDALGRSNMEACVTAAQCDSTAVVSCFQ